MNDRWRWVSWSVRRSSSLFMGGLWIGRSGFGFINGQVRFGQVQFEQIGRASQVQGAGFGQLAQALLEDVGDVFATVGVVLVSILDSPGDLFRAIDLD